MKCWVCAAPVGEPLLDLPSPSLSSCSQLLPAPTQLYACHNCGHVLSPALPNPDAFYSSEYRISLESEDHDQIYEIRDGQPVYRTTRQAEVFLEQVQVPQQARVLDYGAAKAVTLRKIHKQRPDIEPLVFDVSRDYAAYWEGWISQDNKATFELPASWDGTIDVITAHYVFEHVHELTERLTRMRRLLKPGGRLFFSVPDWTHNPGDLLVSDHINHFTARSVAELMRRAGFVVDALLTDALPAAIVCVASLASSPSALAPAPGEAAEDAIDALPAICAFWTRAAEGLAAAAKGWSGRKAAVYGAGFYGAWIASRLGPAVEILRFIDANPQLAGSQVLDLPVAGPQASALDGVDLVFVGLNPAHARRTAAAIPLLNRAGLDVVFLEDLA
jgi:SAM-dependent methyltransferase